MSSAANGKETPAENAPKELMPTATASASLLMTYAQHLILPMETA